MKFLTNIQNTINKIDTNFRNLFYMYLIFVISVFIVCFIFSILFIEKYPNIVDQNNRFILSNIGFNFGEIMSNLQKGNGLKATYFDTNYFVSRMPLLPLTLNFLYNHVSENFFIIIFIKNIFFLTIILLILYNYEIKQKLFFTFISLIILLYNPHNLVTTLSFNFEESLLNYFIIILFLLFFSELNYKFLFISFIISLIFFLKSSMVFLCFGLSIFFFLDNFKKKNFSKFPFFMLILSSLIWGGYSFHKTGFFAYGTKLVSFNSFTLNHAYNDKFNLIYPKISPDTLSTEIVNKLPKNITKNEWKINDYYFEISMDYLKSNPDEFLKGLIKKIQVVFFYFHKDSQFPNNKGEVLNDFRFSNIPNKIFFIIFVFMIIRNFILERSSKNIFIMLFTSLYFFPYMVGFIYTRHATSLYMIATFYLFYEYIYKKKLKNYL
jgi:hypothetical protein